MLNEILQNFLHNLFKPLLLFFYAGFAIPLLNVRFEFPKVIYQGLTIYLLLAIGWHGGEELAGLPPAMYGQALGFMLVGFLTNTMIGCLAYLSLRSFTKLRKVDAATVAGYYGSDSAGTFVTCLGVLTAANIAFASYMPVMLAIMEIPGCLVALVIISRLRRAGMDAQGNMPGEPGYIAAVQNSALKLRGRELLAEGETSEEELEAATVTVEEQIASVAGKSVSSRHSRDHRLARDRRSGSSGSNDSEAEAEAHEAEDDIALQTARGANPNAAHKLKSALNLELLHEVFLNPGIYLLFAGIAIGFISRLQGAKVIAAGDELFVKLFQGCLCLFLLEMGITASRKLKDLRAGGLRFISFALIAPNVFAITGMLVAYGYSRLTGVPLEVGTYVLFAVLCGAASYIAMPAVQRMAIPEASPTLPLAASLGVTFSYNVTIGIPVYIAVANLLVGKA